MTITIITDDGAERTLDTSKGWDVTLTTLTLVDQTQAIVLTALESVQAA